MQRALVVVLASASLALGLGLWSCVGDEPAVPRSDAGTDGTVGGSDTGTGSDAPVVADGGTPCTPNQKKCEGPVLTRCNSAGTQQLVIATCDTAALCLAGTDTACATAACAVGQTRCNDAGFEQCNTDRTGYQNVRTCLNSALCASDAGCLDAGCPAPGYQRCNFGCSGVPDASSAEDCLETCRQNQTRYDYTNCGNAAAGDRCRELDAGVAQCF